MKPGVGRVNFGENDNVVRSYERLYYDKGVENDDMCNAIGVNIEASSLSRMFFSSRNIEILQEAIRYGVYKDSGGEYVISRQSNDELLIIMRSIYLQYGKNIPDEELKEMRILNGEVLKYSIENVLSNVKMFKGFKKDLNTLPIPMERSQNSSTAGSKVLYFKEF